MKTILHVEDDALIVHIYRQALIRAGFEVEVAADGLIASKMLFKKRPDVVVLDLLMPKLAGADVIKFMRSTPALKSTPVIILSDASIADLGIEAITLGAERVFLKSQCSPNQLITAINEILGGDLPVPSVTAPPQT